MNENNELDIKLDPIENTDEFKKIEKELNEKIELFLNTQHISKGTLGYCHAYWETKKCFYKNTTILTGNHQKSLTLRLYLIKMEEK